MYKLTDLLPPTRVANLETKDKTVALQLLLDLLADTGAIPDRVAIERAVLSREMVMSTGVGYGIAVPHARLGVVDEFAVALGICHDGIPYSSAIDEIPVKLICMIVGPNGRHDDYLRILAMLMRFLKSEKGRILSAFSLDEVAGFTAPYDTSQGGPAGENSQDT